MDKSLDITFQDNIEQIEDCDLNMFSTIKFPKQKQKDKSKELKYSNIEKLFIKFAESQEVKVFYTSSNGELYRISEGLRSCISKFNMQDKVAVRLKTITSNDRHDYVYILGMFKKEPMQYSDIKICYDGYDVSYYSRPLKDIDAINYCNKLESVSYIVGEKDDAYNKYLKYCKENGIKTPLSKSKVSILLKSLNLEEK
jgi:hypothetical protein